MLLSLFLKLSIFLFKVSFLFIPWKLQQFSQIQQFQQFKCLLIQNVELVRHTVFHLQSAHNAYPKMAHRGRRLFKRGGFCPKVVIKAQNIATLLFFYNIPPLLERRVYI